MSKSKGNTINIFENDKQLRKTIMKIETDSTPLEEPKDTTTCNVFALYKLMANPAQTAELKNKYEAGNFGYGHAKQALFELIVERFKEQRESYSYYMNHLDEVDAALKVGAEKASTIANEVLSRVRIKLGY
jgi:tryptophanyl-tRNA synthetase